MSDNISKSQPDQAIEGIPINTVDAPSVVLELIYQLKIKDVMSTSLITANKGDTMRFIQDLMRENYITGLPVTEGRFLLGIVSIEDIIKALDQGCIEAKVEDKMTKNVIVLEDDMPLSFAITFLNRYRYGRFPVLNKKKELVGILTSNDVIRALLVEMNREVLRLEKIHQTTAKTPDKSAEMDFAVPKHDFELAGKASTEIKKALKARNIDPKIIRRVAIASYELEINLVVHSMGGTISCSIQPDKIIIVASDTGPGIADINLVLQEGWSTADEWIRSLGFGAGMGLPNTKRNSDEFTIESTVGVGTTVRSVIFINSPKDEA
ncbi:MAG: CBS domain-containing protein [Treponema sp.]|nr:CBS domain-containing protein [Treponema sp.]